MKIALCMIATGNYKRYVDPLIVSALNFFCRKYKVRFFLFTDADIRFAPKSPINVHIVPHEPWPGPTLHRYRTILTAVHQLVHYDYVFYCDADMLFTGTIGDEILGQGLTAVLHPGFAGKPPATWTYERRPESRAYIPHGLGGAYYAGGFQGGQTLRFVAAMQHMARGIDHDTDHGITAVWHDESHWNRYLLENPPAVTLSPLYCSPESWHAEGRKIIALDKNHAELRA
jgi:histo-blood group ABO system transferase